MLDGGRGICRVHMHHTSPNIDFSLHPDIFKGLLAETVLAQGLSASGDGAVGWAG